MDLFGTKKKKQEALEAQRKAAEEAKRDAEIQRKISIRNTLNRMKTQSAKLEPFKKDYIEKAKHGLLINSKSTYNLAKQSLKICLSRQKYLDAMIANMEIALEMTEMNKIIGEFVNSMNLLSEDMGDITSSIDISKAQTAYEKALANNESQYEAIDAFLKEAEGSIESFNGNASDISDEEIDKLINNQATDSESESMDEIDKKIEQLQKKMSA